MNNYLLLPERHPVRDLFVLDVLDVAPRSDMASMSHPVFSLTTRPDRRELTYHNGDAILKIMPSIHGLPTVFDRDILLYVISKLMQMKNAGEPIGKRVRLSTHDLLVSTNRPTNNLGYERLEPALQRLAGTVIETTIKTGDQEDVSGFHLVESYSYRRKGQMGSDRLQFLEVTLSDWVFRAIEGNEVLPISRGYFRLRRAIDRRLYDIGRKHCGTKQEWSIGVDKLRVRVGSKQARRNFVAVLRDVERQQHLPDYTFHLSGDIVTFRRRDGIPLEGRQQGLTNDQLESQLKPDVIEKARQMAREKGLDFHLLKSEFIAFMASKGEEPKNLNGAFLGFIKQKSSAPQ